MRALCPDAGYVTQWLQALRVVRGETQASSQIRVQETLPEDLPEFTGRTAEMDRILQALHQPQLAGDAVVISAIAGMAGVGKTQLAVHTAHLLVQQEAFDRVLFVNLRGFHPEPAQPPADPTAVLDGFLRLLGVPGHQISHDLPARVATYRGRLAGTRTLVILDNAADAEQVGPLLAATPGCLTLVTSRRSLTELDSAVHLSVDVFSPQEAVGFLMNAVPEVPVGADKQAAARIADRCGHLPLALSLVAGHIRGTPGWTLTDHADRLDERHHHRHLDSGIELALDLSYQHLPGDQQRLLRLAALHPGQDLDAYAAAALLDTDLAAAQDLLRHLARDHLLVQPTPGRYGFHDLVRAYAAGRSSDQDPPPQRRAALSRLFDYYLATAAAAMDIGYPSERLRRPKVAPAGTAAPSFSEPAQADLWLDTELANLLASAQHAAEHGWPDHTWHLSGTLSRHLRTRGRHREAETLHEHALRLARHLHNRQAEVNALNCLGYTDRLLGRHEQSSDRFGCASLIAQDIGDPIGELVALAGLGSAAWLAGSYEQSGGYFERALKIAQDIGDRNGERLALASIGDVQRVLGNHERAGECLRQALHIAQDIGDRVGELYALTSLGSVQLTLRDSGPAGSHYAKAWQIAQDIGDRIGELTSLIGLGHVHLALDRHSEAAGYYQQGLDLARELHSENWQFEALQGLGRTHLATGHPELALTHHQQALDYATQLAQGPDQARAHDGLAHAYHARHEHDSARLHWRLALDLLLALGIEQTEEVQTSVANIRAHLSR